MKTKKKHYTIEKMTVQIDFTSEGVVYIECREFLAVALLNDKLFVGCFFSVKIYHRITVTTHLLLSNIDCKNAQC